MAEAPETRLATPYDFDFYESETDEEPINFRLDNVNPPADHARADACHQGLYASIPHNSYQSEKKNSNSDFDLNVGLAINLVQVQVRQPSVIVGGHESAQRWWQAACKKGKWAQDN